MKYISISSSPVAKIVGKCYNNLKVEPSALMSERSARMANKGWRRLLADINAETERMAKMKKRSTSVFSGRNIYLFISLAITMALITLGTVLLGPKIIAASKDPEELKRILGGNSFLGQLMFIGIQSLQVLFAFIPGEFVEIAAGYIYGPIWGTVLCLIGVAPATALIFTLTRLLGKKFTSIMLDTRDLKRLRFLKNEKKLKMMFFLLYFLPGTPKDLITYFAGITKIDFLTFMLISIFCRIPSILTSTLAGSALEKERFVESVIIFAATGVIVIFGWLTFHRLSKRHKSKKDTENKN